MKELLLALVLSGIILIAGCSSDTGSETTPAVSDGPTAPADSEMPAEIEYDPEAIYIYVIAGTVPEYSFINEWQDYIKEKYSLNIKLIYIEEVHPMDTNAEAGVNIDELRKYTGIGGFVYSSHTYNLDSMVAHNLIVPVKDILKDVSALAVLNDSLYENFSYDKETIWAVPMSHQNEIEIRAYNGNWLSKWEPGLPKTPDEFLEYARHIRDSNPDDNGEKDTYIQHFNINMLYSDFLGVFRTYGCYPKMTSFPIDYNPLTEQFEVAAFNEGYEQAINFIKFLESENLVKRTDLYPNTFGRADFKVASTYMYQYDVIEDCETLIPAYFLIGDNDTNLVKLTVFPWSLSVMKNTQNAAENLSKLMDAFDSSPDAGADFECGIKDISYKEHDTIYSFMLKTSDGEKVPRIGIRNDLFPDSRDKKPLMFHTYAANADRMIIINEFKNQHNSDLSAFEESNLLYSISLMKYGNTVDSLNQKIVGLTLKLNKALIVEDKPFRETLEEYRKDLQNLGVFDELAQINGLLNN